MSLTCEETVKLIKSYGSLLSLTVVTGQKPFNSDNSADSEIHTCKPSYTTADADLLYLFSLPCQQ